MGGTRDPLWLGILCDHAEWLRENHHPATLSKPSASSPGARTAGASGEHGHHEFWQCSVSLLDSRTVHPERLHGPRQVTDTYLLALAVSRKGRFVTLDQSVPLNAVHGARSAHLTVL